MSTRLIRVTPEVMEEWSTRDADCNRLSWAWGDPDEAGVYEPVITRHYDDNPLTAERARHAALVAAAREYVYDSHAQLDHSHHCAVPLSEDEDDPRCDCGLAALRAALDGEPHG